MFKFISGAAIATLLAGAAFAQATGQLAEAQMLLDTANVEVTIPEDATDEQVAQIMAIAQGDQNPEQLTMEVKKILGMEE